jgi:sigma-70-like protein
MRAGEAHVLEREGRTVLHRAREFEAFVAGAGGRLLHAATLLTAEPEGAAPLAERLLVATLARTYADWDGLHGEDPYARTRDELAGRYARGSWRYRRPRGGLLDRLPPQERLVLVLRLHEGVDEEQTASCLGLPVDRVHALCARAVATMLSRPRRLPEKVGGPA